MNATEIVFNREAKLLPMGAGHTRPCLVVAGVQVYVYLDGGELRVSVDYDTASPFVTDGEGNVPTRVMLGGEEVHYEP